MRYKKFIDFGRRKNEKSKIADKIRCVCARKKTINFVIAWTKLKKKSQIVQTCKYFVTYRRNFWIIAEKSALYKVDNDF